MNYDNRIDGTPPPAAVLARMTTPESLRARAEIRLILAHQDRKAGAYESYLQNLRIADDMMRRANNFTERKAK